MHNRNIKGKTELSSDFLNMLGLCARAGRCVYGETACLQAIRSNKANLVLVDSDASDNTRKRFGDACAYRTVPLILYERSFGDAARAVGKPSHKVLTVSDKGFADNLLSMTNQGVYAGTMGVEYDES